MRNIPFSPPCITDDDINEVIGVLKSGWLTTGPKTKAFENAIAEYCGTNKAVCLNSATACMEQVLRIFGIEEEDEVITSVYTYTASASVINHVGAKIVLADVSPDSFEMDYDRLSELITDKTKAIIAVDIAGIMCDYDKIFNIIEDKRHLFSPNNKIQKSLGRILLLSDAAHSLGATYKGRRSGSVADFTCFSFHAVKNLTTGEGGALTWNNIDGIDSKDIYKKLMHLSLHGQTKDALLKTKGGSWEYDIVAPYFKCNMTDIMAALGLSQLRRYEDIMARRHYIISEYNKAFSSCNVSFLEHKRENSISSGHLYFLRLPDKGVKERNQIINEMANRGIACNVHYKPLPMLTAYINLGFDISNFPYAYNMYKNEITLPLNNVMTNDDVYYVIENFIDIMSRIQKVCDYV